MHLAPQFLESVLDRRACERQTESCIDLEGSLGDLTLWVLDRLCLVEDDHVPLDLGELLLISTEQSEGCDDQVRVLIELAIGTVVHRHLETRPEL